MSHLAALDPVRWREVTAFIPTREKVGQSLNIAAVTFKWPLNCVANEVIRCIFTRIDPDLVGNLSSEYLEFAKRGGMLLLCVVTSAVALPLLGIGIAIDMLGDKLTQKMYTRLEGRLEPRPLGSPDQFFSMNVNMLPYNRIFGGTRPAPERIDEVLELSDFHNADFIAFQELSFANALKLWDTLRESFPSGFTRIGPNPCSDFDTCLFIASKARVIGEPVFIPLPSANAFKRGLFYIETERCYVMTTHLQSGNSTQEKEVRKAQVKTMIETIKELEKTGKLVVLLMDGNIDRNEMGDEYRLLSDSLMDFYDNEDVTCTNELQQYMRGGEPPEKPVESVDYVAVTKEAYGKHIGFAEFACVPAFDKNRPAEAVSDHHGFKTTITYRQKIRSQTS